MKKTRQSNMELLRIVSMLMVLGVHANGALGLPQFYGDVAQCTAYDLGRIVVEAFTIVCVNCFTMISGFFGINLRWKGLASYLFQCLFYSVGLYCLFCICFPSGFSPESWLDSWLVLSHNDLWYVPAYFGLMLLSPVLNMGFDSLPRRRATMVLVLFAAFNIWSGWWWQGKFNPTGYTLVQLVLVYLMGRYMRLHVDIERLRRHRAAVRAAYLSATACTVIAAFYLPSTKAFAYNSPFVLVSTLALFMLFAMLNFKSRAVNYAAKSAFAVYLIHKNPLVWRNIMKPAMIHLGDTLPGPLLFLAGLALVLAFYAIAMLIDPARRRLSNLIFAQFK